MDRDDVGMIQGCGRTRFLFEPTKAVDIERELLREYFDRDVATKTRISRAIHLAHAAAVEQRDDFVRSEASTGHEGHTRRSRRRGHCTGSPQSLIRFTSLLSRQSHQPGGVCRSARARPSGAVGPKLGRDAILHRMRRARLVAAPATQRSTNSRVHGEHGLDVDDFRMSEDLKRVLRFMREQRDESVVIDTRLVRRNNDAKIATASRRDDIRQQTAIQMTEGAVAEFEIDDAVRFADAFEQSLERWRSRGAFFEQFGQDTVGRSDAGCL
jgi:hypothetical protein